MSEGQGDTIAFSVKRSRRNILGSVDSGESFSLIDETDGWYQIEYKGHTGYIKADSGLAKRK